MPIGIATKEVSPVSTHKICLDAEKKIDLFSDPLYKIAPGKAQIF